MHPAAAEGLVQGHEGGEFAGLLAQDRILRVEGGNLRVGHIGEARQPLFVEVYRKGE